MIVASSRRKTSAGNEEGEEGRAPAGLCGQQRIDFAPCVCHLTPPVAHRAAALLWTMRFSKIASARARARTRLCLLKSKPTTAGCGLTNSTSQRRSHLDALGLECLLLLFCLPQTRL